MRVDEFDFELPSERIAQEPARPRDAARMFVHAAGADETRHLTVADLDQVLEPGDLLIVNDTRVRPARLHGRRATGARVELLLLGPLEDDGVWRAMVQPAKKLKPGETIEGLPDGLVARALERDGTTPFWSVELFDPAERGRSVEELLERSGRMPLPPYIARQAERDDHDGEDRERYQTVYARTTGAVAAPTAGLHFTPELLERLRGRGVERASVTLHVGLGTFLPVTAETLEEHAMHSESYELSRETVSAIAACKLRGGRVVCVGTTSVRVLESCANEGGQLIAGTGSTNIFLTPGYRFRVVDALLTNFHLPKSTLLMLVSALVGRERILRLYAEAMEQRYRFYSYGDAMLFLP